MYFLQISLLVDVNISKKLSENRDLNNMKFYIESSALSKRKLIQKDWDTKPSETLEPNFKWVNTITLEQLKSLQERIESLRRYL